MFSLVSVCQTYSYLFTGTSPSMTCSNLLIWAPLPGLAHPVPHRTPRPVQTCYRPQRSCGKVTFLRLAVILFIHPSTRQATPSPEPGRHPQTRQTSAGETATAADGTHPTGMHSCSWCSPYIYRQAVGLRLKGLLVHFVFRNFKNFLLFYHPFPTNFCPLHPVQSKA